MSSEFEHLQASQRAVAQLSNEERIDWIRQERWIQYPRAKRILERLSELVDYPPRHRMPCLAIYGSTGAAPSSDRRIRSRRYSRGLILWAALLGMLTDSAGEEMERSSPHWPVSLRRRFISALYYCKGRRWPCSPYGTNVATRTAQREICRIYGLGPPLRSSGQNVAMNRPEGSVTFPI